MACYTLPEVKLREYSQLVNSPQHIPEPEKPFVPLTTLLEDQVAVSDDAIADLSREVVDFFASEAEVPPEMKRPSIWSATSGRSFGSEMTRSSSAEDLSEEIAGDLFEFCLSVCMSTGPLALKFVQAIGETERAALRNIISLAKLVGLTRWKDSKLNIVVPLSEAVKVFLEDGENNVLGKKTSAASSEPGKACFRRSGSGLSAEDASAKKRQQFRRSGSGVSQASCGSFSELLKVKDCNTVGQEEEMPMFLDVLLGLVADDNDKVDISMPNFNDGFDMRKRFGTSKSVSNLSKQELISEAGLSYHSVDDSLVGDGNGSKTASFTAMGGQIRLGFKTKCLKTQAAVQKRVLSQQKQLLNSMTNKLHLAERVNLVGQKVINEQRDALMPFRKVASRPKMQVAEKLTVWIVEPDQELREQLMELCVALGYRCHAFETFAKAQERVACQTFENKHERPDKRMRTIYSCTGSGDMAPIASVESADSSCSVQDLQATILEGKPGIEFDDWRSHALQDQQGSGLADVHFPKDPDGGLQLVLVSPSCLQEFPAQWAHVRPAVVLTSQPEEIDNIFHSLELSSPNLALARAQLAVKGICEWLIHPISMQAMLDAVKQVFRSHIYEEYLTCERLGNGTSGIVNAVLRTADGRTFAMKEVNTKNRKQSRTFEHECQVLKELQWPTVLFAVDTWYDTATQLRHLVMPLLPDKNLESKLAQRLGGAPPKQEPITDETTVQQLESWCLQTFHGLAYIHYRGLIHRDIKPANLALYGQGTGLMIVDFGSSVVLDGDGPFPNRRTVSGGVTSPIYSPPEAFADKLWSAASDLWSAGACFYEMVTGKTLLTAPASASEEVLATTVQALDFDKSKQKPIFSTCATNLPTLAQVVPSILKQDPLSRPPAAKLIAGRARLHNLKTVLSNLGTFAEPEDAGRHMDCFSQIANVAAKSTAA